MKQFVRAAIIGTLSAVALAGCGGGGGSAPVTTATTKVFLFGTMSSNGRIAGVTTSMTVPGGVMVNYSTAPGVMLNYSTPHGIFPLKSGAVLPTGPVRVSSASGSYDNAGHKLTISLVNGTFLNLSSSTTRNSGKGTEIALINFTLAKPGGTPILPASDLFPIVRHDRPSLGIFGDYLNGCTVNFTTTYQ
jgi:hypothetical protein